MYGFYFFYCHTSAILQYLFKSQTFTIYCLYSLSMSLSHITWQVAMLKK